MDVIVTHQFLISQVKWWLIYSLWKTQLQSKIEFVNAVVVKDDVERNKLVISQHRDHMKNRIKEVITKRAMLKVWPISRKETDPIHEDLKMWRDHVMGWAVGRVKAKRSSQGIFRVLIN